MVSWAHPSPCPNSILIGSAVLAELAVVTNRHRETNRRTYRPRYIRSNRPHPMAMRDDDDDACRHDDDVVAVRSSTSTRWDWRSCRSSSCSGCCSTSAVSISNIVTPATGRRHSVGRRPRSTCRTTPSAHRAPRRSFPASPSCRRHPHPRTSTTSTTTTTTRPRSSIPCESHTLFTILYLLHRVSNTIPDISSVSAVTLVNIVRF